MSSLHPEQLRRGAGPEEGEVPLERPFRVGSVRRPSVGLGRGELSTFTQGYCHLIDEERLI